MPAIHRFFSGTAENPQIVILNVGSKSTHRFAYHCRRAGIRSRIMDSFCLASHARRTVPKGIIISGGPGSVYDPDVLHIPCDEIMRLCNTHGTAVLGVCLAAQAFAHRYGGKVERATHPEIGIRTLNIPQREAVVMILEAMGGYHGGKVVMNHADDIVSLPSWWKRYGSTEQSAYAFFGTRKMLFTLFHPELEGTENGEEIMRHFLFERAACTRDYDSCPEAMIAEMVDFIRQAVPTGSVVVAVSGGVDSTLTLELFRMALGRDRVWGVFVDNGFLRQGEAQEVRRLLGDDHMIYRDARERFYEQIEAIPWVGRTEREYFVDVRRVISHMFIDVFADTASSIPFVVAVGQGTNHSDIWETHTRLVQHHNVGDDLAERLGLPIVEPLAGVLKSEIRLMAASVDLDSLIVHRQPSPGPGNAIRMPMPVTRAKAESAGVANRVLDRLILTHYPDPRDRPTQWYVALRPGLMAGNFGDREGDGHELMVRAVRTADHVSADIFYFPEEIWRDIDESLRAHVVGPDGLPIVVVAYNGSSKPPARIEPR